MERARRKGLMFLTAFFEAEFKNTKDIYRSPVIFNFHKLNRHLASFLQTVIVNIYNISENVE